MSQQANKTVLITGTSSGIGEAFAVLAKTIPKRISRSIDRKLIKRSY